MVNGVEKENSLNDRIKLGHVVDNITVNGKVMVHVQNGQRFTGDYVIVTIPLGLLKKDVIKFTPQLSEKKRNAINNVGFGTVNKVFLEFNSSLGDDSVHIYYRIQSKFDNRNYFNDYYNMKRWTNRNSFFSLSTSTEDQNSEEYSDSSLEDTCIMRLAIIFNKTQEYVRKNLIAMNRTKWKSDEFSKGSYSYPKVG